MAKSVLSEESREKFYQLLDIISHNLKEVMDDRLRTEANKPAALAKRSKVGKYTIQRLLKGSNNSDPEVKAPGLDKLVALAWHLEIPLQRLLVDSRKSASFLQPLPHISEGSPARDLERRRGRTPAE